jgi:hypothetical protein
VASWVVSVAALAVSVFALLFTIASFWWLHARRGKIEATKPRAFAFVTSSRKVRLRLPLAFHNTGAAALVVSDLRLALDGDTNRSHFDWVTTRDTLRPEKEDGFRFPHPSLSELLDELAGCGDSQASPLAAASYGTANDPETLTPA